MWFERSDPRVLEIPTALDELIDGILHFTMRQMNTLSMSWQEPLKGMVEQFLDGLFQLRVIPHQVFRSPKPLEISIPPEMIA